MKKKVARYIINVFTLVMGFIFLTLIAAVDFDSWIPFVGLFVSGGWLYVYAAAKGYVYGLQDGDGK